MSALYLVESVQFDVSTLLQARIRIDLLPPTINSLYLGHVFRDAATVAGLESLGEKITESLLVISQSLRYHALRETRSSCPETMHEFRKASPHGHPEQSWLQKDSNDQPGCPLLDVSTPPIVGVAGR